MSIRKIIIPVLFLAGFLFFYALGHSAVRTHRKALSANYTMSVTPVPAALTKILAGEFRGIAADLLLRQVVDR